MKKITLICCMFFLVFSVFAQKNKPVVPEKIAKLPVFTVYKVNDSTAFTEKDLEKNKRTIFIYFGADCGHCMYFSRKLRDSIAQFENTQILMVSSSEFSKTRKFYEDQGLDKCSIVTVGHDAKFFFPSHFDVRMFPSAYVYNKKGRFVKSFSNEISIQDLIH
jgi:peroxiredoxin